MLNSFLPEQQRLIQNWLHALPANCYCYPQRLPGEAQFNAVIDTCDILFAAYHHFPSSSNLLAKAALFEKPVIASEGYCMGERVERYGLGVTVTEGDVAQTLAAIHQLYTQLENESRFTSARFAEYRQVHSIERLHLAFQQALSRCQSVKPMPIPISAIVLTKNEEDNLPDCLASLGWADEIVVVDSFSTDRTVEIARKYGARVVQHPFQDYAAQHNFAQGQTAYDWVIFIDADERVSAELAQEIRTLADSGALTQFNAYHIERLHLISGRWMYSNPARRRLTPRYRQHLKRVENPRLIDRRQGVWERPLHEIVRAPEPHGVLSGVIYHYANTNLSATFESLNSYTDREADYLYHMLKRNRVSVLEALNRGLRTFLYLYVWWGWWKLGEQGLLMALINGYTKFVNYAKLGERLRIAHNHGQWTERDRQLLKQFDAAHPDHSAEDQT